jgi:hypothetical protein
MNLVRNGKVSNRVGKPEKPFRVSGSVWQKTASTQSNDPTIGTKQSGHGPAEPPAVVDATG